MHNSANYDGLVTLTVESLGVCPDLLPRLVESSPQRDQPVTLGSKQKLNVFFEVTYRTNCVNDVEKGNKQNPVHDDYRYLATVHHEAIDGKADTPPEDDIGPREARPPFEVDPNPDGTIKDKGVGKKKSDMTFGADVTTDVRVR